MAILTRERKSLLSSQARVQAPWIKVTIGAFTFGVYSKKEVGKDAAGFYTLYDVQYPNYVKSLSIIKMNGQVNQYTLDLDYPIRPQDDPNFFEKVFSSVSKSRKIVFSYGDASMPTYIYKDEEALITKVTQQFDLQNSVIKYKVQAVSSAIIGHVGNFCFPSPGVRCPSEVIKEIFFNKTYHLEEIFKGVTAANINSLIEAGDKAVKIYTKTNMSPLDYIAYLVSCMVPDSSDTSQLSNAIYVLTYHDDTIYGDGSDDDPEIHGPYFRVTKTSYAKEQSDAYELDVGFNTSTIVTNFSINKDENYSMFFDYINEFCPEQYTRRLDDKGGWTDVFAPTFTSGNDKFKTTETDMT